PAAADALQQRRPDLMVAMGGYQDHLPHVGAAEHVVRGELRSPAFAPVLAGVASARIREKQQAAHATVMLQRYAEPLAAWAALARASRSAPSTSARCSRASSPPPSWRSTSAGWIRRRRSSAST